MFTAWLISLGIAFFHYFTCEFPYRIYIRDYLDYPGMFILPHNSFSMRLGFDGASFYLALSYLVIPVLASFPFAGSFLQDKKTGYLKNVLSRATRIQYGVAKYFAVFISAGTIAVTPLLADFLLSSATYPYIGPLPAEGCFGVYETTMFHSLFYSMPYWYVVAFLALNFVFFGALATLSLCVAFSVERLFFVELFPFLVYFILYIALNVFNLVQYCPFFFLRPDQGVECNPVFVLGVTAALLVGSFLFYAFHMKHEDVF